MGLLDGQTAWITGGGSGIGAAGARALAEAGAAVVLSGRRSEPLEAVAEEIRAAGGTARTHPVDVSDSAAVAEAVAEIGRVDILLANAGLNLPQRNFGNVSIEGWDRIVDVNLNGVFYPVQAVLPGMRDASGGLLILISSWAGRYATRLTGPAYNATKRAVLALSESVNEEECRSGIRSTVIMPGEVATEIMKSRPVPPSEDTMARMLQAEDLARTIRFVAEAPPHVCLNEILISPTWNRFYTGFDEG